MKTSIMDPYSKEMDTLGSYITLVVDAHDTEVVFTSDEYHDTLRNVVQAEEFYLGMHEAAAKRENIMVIILTDKQETVGYILANEEELA
jgi:hypothetical protein